MYFVFPWEKKLADYSKEFNEMEKSGLFASKDAIKIAVLGSHTLNYFSQLLSVRLAENGIPAKVWTAPYGQIEGQLLNSTSELAKFKPDFVLVVQDLNDVLGEPSMYLDFKQSEEEKKQAKAQVIVYCQNLVEEIKLNTTAYALITNFQTPHSTIFGSMEQKHQGSRRIIQEINLALADEINKHKNTTLIDLDAACANAGKIDTMHEKFRFLGDVHLSFRQSVMLAEEVLGAVISLKGKSKKCIVLDLDNTLWGGVIGEDGLSGIKLGQTEPIGKAFQEFQKEILKLHKRGIILAINSKNNYETAMQAINTHPEMILKEEHFSAIRTNWQDKATNLQELAEELNISLDSIVFIDDDPFNIELVKTQLPSVTCILLPKEPSSYPLLIKTLKLFDTLNLTEEDYARGKMYAEDKTRKENLKSFKNYADFLMSLNLTIAVKEADSFTIPRISQMSLRTNQFNMTMKRYSEADITKIVQNPEYKIYWMTVKDKFGDYGIAGACIVQIDKKQAIVDSFFMSCRVLGKEIENAFICKVMSNLKQNGVETIKTFTIPTNENKAFLDFYIKTGFTKKGKNNFEFNLKNTNIIFPKHIKWA